MRVLFVDHQAEVLGGGQRSLLGLMGELERQGHVAVLACPEGGSLARLAVAAGHRLVPVEMPALRPARCLAVTRAVARLYRSVRRHGAQLVHANGSRCMFYGGLAARLAGVPALWHVRVAEPDGAWDRLLGRLASRVIVISEAVGRRLAGRVGAGGVRLIYNGEEVERFARADGSAARRDLAGQAALLVGMVARLTPEKDQETFLRAAALIAAQVPEARFALVGEDPAPGRPRRRQLAELAARLGLGERVTFAGYREDVPEVMAALDLLVHCAWREGLGRALIEAMAAARPVVAAAVGGIPEVVRDGQTGLLVPPGQPQAVAAAAVSLLRDPARREAMGRAGQARARQCFSLAAHAAQVLALYREVAAAP